MFLRLLVYAVIGLLIALGLNVLYVLDINKRTFGHRPGRCRYVNGINDGSEDLDIVRSKDIAFISSGIYYMTQRRGVKGEIFLYDFNQPVGHYDAKKLKLEGNFDRSKFFPHGISTWVDGDKIRLFVVNHSPPDWTHAIEVFDFDEKTLTLNHKRTIKDPNFVRPNDLIALGPDSFIMTNDGTTQSAQGNHWEILTSYRGGSVVYYDGQTSHVLASSQLSPNGVTVNKKRTHLFVASPNGEYLSVYKLAKDFKSIELVNRIDLYTSADNLNEDEEGGIWIGSWPNFGSAGDYINGKPGAYSPAQVLRITFSPDYKSESIREVYADDGQELSGSTVAGYHKKQLLVGSLNQQLLHCDVTDLNVV